jgi:hypothetical protein
MRLLFLLSAVALAGARAESNIDPEHSISPSDLIGPLNWRPSTSSGAILSKYYCSGNIYSPNVGWINLSSGAPKNGITFANNSASDYGVNVSPSGDLTGFAYGANIGWINFAASGKPHIDFVTGKLSGSVWAANIGWLPLLTAEQYLRVESLPDLPDADADGLADAWEMQMVGNLAILSAGADNDEDGQSDLEEYLSGTDPFDTGDFLGPVQITVSVAGTELQFPTKADHLYRVEQHPAFGSGSWSVAPASTITGTGARAVVKLPSNPSKLFFYRVAAYPPLTNLQ